MIQNKHSLLIGFCIGGTLSLLFCFTIRDTPLVHDDYYPKSTFLCEQNGYTLAYDGRTKGAIWVYELMTPDLASLQTVSRDNYRFIDDEKIPELLRATNEDFRGSGYDRGHLHPAINARFSSQAMQDSFLLTNASPQLPSLNRGLWKSLEREIFEIALNGKTVHVYTLPLYIPIEINNERFVHYRLIGENDVAVPTHFAKVAIIEGEETPMAYILPNEVIVANTPLDNFKTTVEKIERVAGVILPRPHK